jgi:hypothetical protein
MHPVAGDPRPSSLRVVLRTVAGIALVVVGLFLLVLPGPGVAVIALGLLLLDPRLAGRLAHACRSRPRLLRVLNACRRRLGKPALAPLGPDLPD